MVYASQRHRRLQEDIETDEWNVRSVRVACKESSCKESSCKESSCKEVAYRQVAHQEVVVSITKKGILDIAQNYVV
jgi:hypothetical protein